MRERMAANTGPKCSRISSTTRSTHAPNGTRSSSGKSISQRRSMGLPSPPQTSTPASRNASSTCLRSVMSITEPM